MATTVNRGMTLLEVGQKEKELTINTNFQIIDNAPMFLGRLAANPSVNNVSIGSYYFNTATNRIVYLTQITPTVIWSNAS